jgi:pantoate--beta-alanine ligase
MEVIRTIDSARQCAAFAKQSGKIVGLVPTMGALHAGHISLIQAARRDCGFVVVSIFVNPTQFGPLEDFDKYPRPIEQDLEICREQGVDMVFAPDVREMYPKPNITWVVVEEITEKLCGRSRGGHFRGVTTVCSKLFNIVGPDIAFFGQKDAQQAVVIKRMVADLNMPLKIHICPTVRESDGLAMSSRNKYLSEAHRKDAVLIYQSLRKAEQLIADGVAGAAKIINEMEAVVSRSKLIEPEYIEIVDYDTLEPVNPLKGKVLIAVAVRLGPARLIDNIVVDVVSD